MADMPALKKPFMAFAFSTSLILVISGTAWAWIALRNLPHPLILHFNDISGILEIGGIGSIISIGGSALVLVLVNALLAFEVDERHRVWGKVVAAATLAMSILIFIGIAAIISVN